MRKQDIKTAEDALLYLTDCTLATVAHLAMLKRPPAGELRRQISIAQIGCDHIARLNLDPAGTRAEEIVDQMTVEQWADEFRVKR